ncbi:MAG: hypothetical protein NTZ50_05515, partial [Chloroflexi bacterium]|nr:hypothetical protein [Chloroflexota bacterium]
AAAIIATTFWHVALSRVAFRAITLPLVLSITAALLFAALRARGRRRTALAFACGLTFGATFYTYASGQFIAPLFVLTGISLFVISRARVKANARAIAAACAGALLVLAPFLIWLSGHIDLYFARAGQVSVLNAAINGGDLAGTLLRNTLRVLGMFTFTGDRIWRHNDSLRPVFTDFIALAFLIGALALTMRTWKQRTAPVAADALAAPFALVWLLIFLAPSALAEDAPHFLRAIGALPAACIVAAVGLEAALKWASRRGLLVGLARGPLYRRVSPPALLATAALIVSGVRTYTDYFDVYAKRDVVAYWLEAQNTALAAEVTGAPGDVWLDQRLASDNATLDFLAARSFTPFDPATPPPDLSARSSFTAIFDPNHNWDALRRTLPTPAHISIHEGPLAQGDLDPQPRRSFIAISVQPARSVDARVTAEFDQGIRLLDARVLTSTTPGHYAVELLWDSNAPIDADYAVFAHLNAGENLVAQHDGSPANGRMPMNTWRPGQQIVDVHEMDAATTPDTITVGIYRREDGIRLNVTRADGTKADYVIIPLR